MKAFSNGLMNLYESAEQTDPDEFATEVIRIVGKFVFFDGAVLGSGIADPIIPGNLLVGRGHIYERDITLLQEYAAISADDPITKMFVDGLMAPASFALQDYYQTHHIQKLFQFCTKHDLKNMVLYGRAPSLRKNARWLALFRNGTQNFDDMDCAFVDALWPHLERAIDINLQRTFKHREEKSHTCAGFINLRGFLEVAEPGFLQLLQLEWPGHSQLKLPASAISAIMKKQIYQGKHIRLVAVRCMDYLICTAQRLDHAVSLGPSEKQVAHYFASGMTNKEIACRVGTSPHTVRMQLKNVYRKLNVHSKIELARAINGNDRIG